MNPEIIPDSPVKYISNFIFIVLYVQNNFYKMDSFEINKILAAILMVALIIIGIGREEIS